MGGLPPLTGKWRGPARVLKRLGPVSFEIQMKALPNHLKRHCPPNELSYAAEGKEENGDDDDDNGDGDAAATEPQNSVDRRPWCGSQKPVGLLESLKMLSMMYPGASRLMSCNVFPYF